LSITALCYVLIYFYGLLKAFTTNPVYGLYTYLFAFYLHAPARWWGRSLPDLRWSFLAALVTLIAIFSSPAHQKKVWFSFFENKLFAFFVFYLIIQSFWALNFEIHKEYLFLGIKFLILIFIIQNSMKSEKDIIGFVVLNLLGVCYFTYLGMFVKTGGRLEGLGTPGMESANQLGQHMATILVFSAFLLMTDLGKKKFLLIVPLVLALNGVLLTQSRGVMIGVLVAGFASLFVIPPKAKKQFVIYACLAIFGGSALVGPQLIERFSSIAPDESGEQDKSAESRMVIINAQMDMFFESPLLGYGHRGTLLLSKEFIPAEYHTKTKGGSSARASHNFLFALLVDHGLVGTTLYLLIVFSCLVKMYKISKTTRYHEDSLVLVLVLTGMGLSLICLMVAGMGSNNKKLEIDIWLYAMIPVIYGKIMDARRERESLGSEHEADAQKEHVL